MCRPMLIFDHDYEQKGEGPMLNFNLDYELDIGIKYSVSHRLKTRGCARA